MRGLASLAHVREVMRLQPLNASYAMLVTLAGMLMDLNSLQPENALSPIVFTPFCSTTSFRDSLQYCVNTCGLTSFAHVREAMGQPSNAQLPKLVTLAGMLMDVNPLQPSNAYFPMLVTPSEMLTEVNPLQPRKT